MLAVVSGTLKKFHSVGPRMLLPLPPFRFKNRIVWMFGPMYGGKWWMIPWDPVSNVTLSPRATQSRRCPGALFGLMQAFAAGDHLGPHADHSSRVRAGVWVTVLSHAEEGGECVWSPAAAPFSLGAGEIADECDAQWCEQEEDEEIKASFVHFQHEITKVSRGCRVSVSVTPAEPCPTIPPSPLILQRVWEEALPYASHPEFRDRVVDPGEACRLAARMEELCDAEQKGSCVTERKRYRAGRAGRQGRGQGGPPRKVSKPNDGPKDVAAAKAILLKNGYSVED